MNKVWNAVWLVLLLLGAAGCAPKEDPMHISAAQILGDPDYLGICYGGYRQTSRDIEPTLEELKEDMRILSAMGIKIVRTYHASRPHAAHVLQAIRALKEEDPTFEMYVMLGAWIDCENAWTDLPPNHEAESAANAGEIGRAAELARAYPEIVKIIAVGNEAMVRWQERYYVQPGVILKWVNHLQALKKSGALPADLWITCSDDFASWGGGDASYHTPDLAKLIHAVDYISMHTYPMHNTYYSHQFWVVPEAEYGLSDREKIAASMARAEAFAKKQYADVVAYMRSVGADKPVHIGETGWATQSNGYYGPQVSRAADEYKSAVYYDAVRAWTRDEQMACFYFEAFDEPWKDAANAGGSENHFGLFTVDGQAKHALWSLVDDGTFDGLGRGGNPITKTLGGDLDALMKTVLVTPADDEMVGHQ